MNVTVLDGYTTNPGDLSWDPLIALGACTIHDRTAARLTLRRARGAEILLTNKTVLSGPTLEQLPELRYIGVLATGYNVVDIVTARKRGVPVTNVPDYGTPAVAQMVFAHLLNLTQHVAHHAQTVRGGRWTACRDFCYWDFPLVELSGLTMGIVGLGRIGTAVAQIARAYGMRVIAHDPSRSAAFPSGIGKVALEPLFHESDVVTLHCPLTDENERFVGSRLLGLMKPSAVLLNTGRGPLIDEQALADALDRGVIAGAGLDVLSVEPPAAANPLLKAKNCHITPHIAWATRAARKRLLDIAVGNAEAFLRGEPRNVVNT